MEFLDYRAIVEIVVLVAVAVGAYKAQGFRRPNNPGNLRNNKTQMTKDITGVKVRVGILEKNQTVLFQKVDKIGEDVSFMRGRMEREDQ